MIPRVSRLGTGFVSAGLYYLHNKRTEQEEERPSAEQYMLHDKGGAQSYDRLGFVELRNLPVRDPNPDDKAACYEAAGKALRCMAWVAAHAKDIRQASVAAAAKAAGMAYDEYVRAFNPYRGRPGQKPLYSLSIAWHPSRNRKPTRQEMIAAADEVLAALGMSDRQCVILEHRDRPHPHVHLIINRVSPHTGLYAKTSNDYLKVSAWALDWERRTGLILCTERMFNWERRNANRQAKALARLDDPHAKGAYVRGKDVPRADRDWWKAHEHLSDDRIRAAREERQKGEAARFQEKAARQVLLADAKIARTLSKDRAVVLKQLHELKERAQQKPVRQRGLSGRVVELFRKTADAITRGPARRRGAIDRLRDSAQALAGQTDERKKAARDDVAAAWARLEKRHEVERLRDEERIARRQREARGRQTGDRALTQFNLRGQPDTARHVQPKDRPLILTHAYAVASGLARTAKRSPSTWLERITERIGWRRETTPASPPQITPAEPASISPPARQRTVDPTPDFRAAASPPRSDTPNTQRADQDYERRVEKKLEQLERGERRERRRRKRPRAKLRRLEG